MEKSFVKWGLYLGLAAVILSFGLYMIDVTLMVSGWVSLISYALIITFMILSARQERSERDGYLTYGQAVINSLGVSVIYTIITISFTGLLYNVIDPELPETLKTITIERMASTMESFGMAEADIDKAIEATEARDFKQDFRALATGALVLIAINFVIGLIVSIFTRKNPPMFEANESEA